MAKGILTVEDTKDGGISVSVDFEPPVIAGETGTAAQYYIAKAMELMTEQIHHDNQ